MCLQRVAWHRPRLASRKRDFRRCGVEGVGIRHQKKKSGDVHRRLAFGLGGFLCCEIPVKYSTSRLTGLFVPLRPTAAVQQRVGGSEGTCGVVRGLFHGLWCKVWDVH